MGNNLINKIPKEVLEVGRKLVESGYDAYLVGGCVRDLLLSRKPKDWDFTTNAKPEEIQAIFEHSFYENQFGTVGVVNDEITDETLKVVEITPYRIESAYSDSRRPDTVTFSDKLEDDLKRRDFTVNSVALDLKDTKGQIVDLYKGQEDLKAKVIRTVGNPDERFQEDALRILRAIRIACELGFTISHETYSSIMLHGKQLKNISKERIRDEFIRIIMSNEPMVGMSMIEKFGLLGYISEDLLSTVGVDQNKSAHKYTVWEHLLRSLQHASNKGWSLEIRLASLFHDISKPYTKRKSTKKEGECTFYGHEVIGARVTRETLLKLKFPLKVVEKVEKLVRWHMFFSDTEQITLSAVRRLIVNVGMDNVWDLMNVRACDRIGTGRPKESPYRLRKYHAMIEEALRDPISLSMLKINGSKIIDVTRETAGPRIGWMLFALFNEVLDDPELNTSEYLEKRTIEMSKFDNQTLQSMGEKGKEIFNFEDKKSIEDIKNKHGVK
jgi:tRNA nucleotidyltransferase (CCA-adding enzyme)